MAGCHVPSRRREIREISNVVRTCCDTCMDIRGHPCSLSQRRRMLPVPPNPFLSLLPPHPMLRTHGNASMQTLHDVLVAPFDYSCQSPNPLEFSVLYKHPWQHIDHHQHSSLFIKNLVHSFETPTNSHSLWSLLCPYLRSLIMKTRQKNKSKHPAAPIMTPGQLAAAGIPQPLKQPRWQPTKDQCIAALEEDLRLTRELLHVVLTPFTSLPDSLTSSRRTLLVLEVALGHHQSHRTTMVIQNQQPKVMATLKQTAVNVPRN